MSNVAGSKWIRPEKRLALYARDGFACVYCGATAESGASLSLDHVKPRELGGGHAASNLVTSCVRCNSARQDSSLTAWLETLRDAGRDADAIPPRRQGRDPSSGRRRGRQATAGGPQGREDDRRRSMSERSHRCPECGHQFNSPWWDDECPACDAEVPCPRGESPSSASCTRNRAWWHRSARVVTCVGPDTCPWCGEDRAHPSQPRGGHVC